MSEDYTPPKVWTWNKESGGRFAAINRPIAGPTHDKELPVGKHPMQLYSLGTPNGLNAANLKVAELYVGAFGNLAKAGNTLIVPANLADIASLIGSATTVLDNVRGIQTARTTAPT